ncbi:hypothetical protein SBOR_5686 [Sclerotinia borealis F-4128]|uniref:Uncharacterized protein n=1 Tax=Sclerotinia borealis (strain F-4128) TaxID=1432307 RepID=W9CB06_SCLBF|nr:hypothetical protein SBOR_5686 [Sclerotinia borealis F-4128]
MPLTRRLSQFFSSSPSLHLLGKDMNTFDITTTSTPASSPPSISEEVIFSSAIEAEDQESSQTSVEQSPNATKRPHHRKTIKKIFRRFSLHSSPKDSTTIPRTLSPVSDVVIVETPPDLPTLTTTTDVPPRDSHERIDYTRIQISSLPFPFPDLASPLRKSINAGQKLECSDSGYFSLTSVSSSSLSPSAPSPTLRLIRRINKAILLLEYQELLTTRFSTNLAYLFGKKEMAIWRTRKMSDDTKELIIIILTKLRELVGKTMVHKTGLVRRSRCILGEVVEAIVSNQRRDSGVETETPASEIAEHTPSPEVVEMSGSEPESEGQGDMKETLETLRADIAMQKRLDEVLRAGIVGSCGDENLMMGLPSRSERLCLRRFVGFVEGRVTELGGAYARVEKAVGGLERYLTPIGQQGIQYTYLQANRSRNRTPGRAQRNSSGARKWGIDEKEAGSPGYTEQAHA